MYNKAHFTVHNNMERLGLLNKIILSFKNDRHKEVINSYPSSLSSIQ